MPKTSVQFEAIRMQSAEKIKTAALQLFATKGFSGTSIGSIAESANISKGLLYNYFDSKDDLLISIVQTAIDEAKNLFDGIIRDYKEPEDEIRHLVEDSISMVKKNFEFYRLISAISFQEEIMSKISDIVQDNRQYSIEKGIQIFEKLGSPTPMKSALLFGAALDGLVLYYLHMKEDLPLDGLAQSLIDTFLDKNSIHRGLSNK